MKRKEILLTPTFTLMSLHLTLCHISLFFPHTFSSQFCQDFDAWFNLSSGGLEKKEMIEKLHALLKPFLLRRLKAEVEKDLPPKKETKIYVGLSKMQRQWYTKVGRERG